MQSRRAAQDVSYLSAPGAACMSLLESACSRQKSRSCRQSAVLCHAQATWTAKLRLKLPGMQTARGPGGPTCGHKDEAVEHAGRVGQARKAEGPDPQVLGRVLDEALGPVAPSHNDHEVGVAVTTRQGAECMPLQQEVAADAAKKAISHAAPELEDHGAGAGDSNLDWHAANTQPWGSDQQGDGCRHPQLRAPQHQARMVPPVGWGPGLPHKKQDPQGCQAGPAHGRLAVGLRTDTPMPSLAHQHAWGIAPARKAMEVLEGIVVMPAPATGQTLHRRCTAGPGMVEAQLRHDKLTSAAQDRLLPRWSATAP